MNDRGFTLLEMCLVLACMSLTSFFFLPSFLDLSVQEYTWPSAYLLYQATSIASADDTDFHTEQGNVHFNEKGNVRSAQTIRIHKKMVVSELGQGKLIFK